MTAAQLFKEGDIVVLKSGGPDMTVMEVVGDNVTCWWANDELETDSAVFKATSLVRQESVP